MLQRSSTCSSFDCNNLGTTKHENLTFMLFDNIVLVPIKIDLLSLDYRSIIWLLIVIFIKDTSLVWIRYMIFWIRTFCSHYCDLNKKLFLLFQIYISFYRSSSKCIFYNRGIRKTSRRCFGVHGIYCLYHFFLWTCS